MSDRPILIKRYPNRRYYASNTSSYISLREIEELVQAGHSIEIRDSQTGDDLTRAVLTQIIMERHPEKMSVFPIEMLHFILRSNEVMNGLLRDYFRQSSTYLDYLERYSTAATGFLQPAHWVKTWLDGLSPTLKDEPQPTPPSESAALTQRIRQLEERLEQLESPE
jgi:polyhydroxyalkanoate synthesis repressor PhaR